MNIINEENNKIKIIIINSPDKKKVAEEIYKSFIGLEKRDQIKVVIDMAQRKFIIENFVTVILNNFLKGK